jgi:hypothetical protein
MVIAVFDRLEGGRANIEALVPDVRALLTRDDL